MAIAGLVPRAAKRLVGAEAEARARVIVAALLGIGAAAAARPWSPWQLTILVGWDVGAGVFLAAVWWIIARADSRATAALATREDETRASASFLLLCASTISLVGVALGLIEAKAAGGSAEVVLTVAAVLTVVLSWALLGVIKQYVAAGFPSMFGFPVYPEYDSPLPGALIPFPSPTSPLRGGHANVVVGYDDNLMIGADQGALLVRNSWGTGWGDAGYGWLSYRYVTEGLADDFWSVIKASWVQTGNF